MLFYYLCTVGEKLHKEAYPQGAQSKDADVYKWVALHSGSPAVCQREHEGAHLWRPDEGGDEERVVRGYAVLQWDKQGFDLAKRKPDVGEAFDSPCGTSWPTRARSALWSHAPGNEAPSPGPAARESYGSPRSRSESGCAAGAARCRCQIQAERSRPRRRARAQAR